MNAGLVAVIHIFVFIEKRFDAIALTVRLSGLKGVNIKYYETNPYVWLWMQIEKILKDVGIINSTFRDKN